MNDPAIRRILTGVDRGDLATHALAVAMELAEVYDARLDVVHAVDLHPPLRGNASTKRWAEASAKAIEEARKELEGRLSLTVEHPRFADVPPGDYTTVTVGRPAAALLEFAREHEVDLIVLGGHRHRKVFDFGGTARAVFAESSCPVWVQAGAPRKVGTILAAIDLSDSSELVLAMARSLAGKLSARVQVLHCFQPPSFAYDSESEEAVGTAYVVSGVRDDERDEFARRFQAFDWHGVSADSLFTEGEPSDEILERGGEADLIVMGTHGRTGLARAVLGSQAYKVLRAATRPVLAIPQTAQKLLSR